MIEWNELIKKATIGTGKLPPVVSDIPSAILQRYEMTVSGDAEEDFFRFSVPIFQMKQTGALPVEVSDVAIRPAEVEVKPHCSEAAVDALKSVLAMDHLGLLDMWLTKCVNTGVVVKPEMVPALFEVAVEKKQLRELILKVGGSRGQWLAELNPEWSCLIDQKGQSDLWETGTLEERKNLLLHIRKVDPIRALEVLESTWASEAAGDKVAFLEILKTGLSEADLPWLQKLNEKAQKVKGSVMELLRSIPSSPIVVLYKTFLQKAVTLRSGKGLLGMINTTTLEIDEAIEVLEEIFSTGIEKLSGDKKVTDFEHVLSQVMMFVPPAFWDEHLAKEPQYILNLFKKNSGSLFINALAMASLRYGDIRWIRDILDFEDREMAGQLRVALIARLPAKERQAYANTYLKEHPRETIGMLLHAEEEWSVELAKAILTHTANEAYSYNRNFYRQAVPLIPVDMLEKVYSITPANDQMKVFWKNQAEDLVNLLSLKKQILQSFNA